MNCRKRIQPQSTRKICTVCLASLIVLVVILDSSGLAVQQQTEKTVSAPATIRGYQTADLYAKVGGYITEMLVDIGDKVEKDQPLVKIDVPELRQQLVQMQTKLLLAEAEAEQARALVVEAQAQLAGFEAAVTEAVSRKSEKTAMLKFEEKDCERITQLVGRGAIGQEMLDAATYQCEAAISAVATADASIATAKAMLAGARAAVVRSQADVKAAKAQIQVAESNVNYVHELLKYTMIRAPFKGEISKRMYDAGSFVPNAEGNSAAKPILQIVRTDKMRLAFSLSMSDISTLDRGDKVKLTRIDALPDVTIEGKVSRFSAALDSVTRMMNIEVDLDNADGKLKPGYFGYVELFPSG